MCVCVGGGGEEWEVGLDRVAVPDIVGQGTNPIVLVVVL